MTTKCWNLDRAEDAFTDALWEAASVPVITKKQEIIYKAIQEIKDNILPELWEDAQQLISDSINDYPEVKQAAAGYKTIFNPNFNFQYWSNRMSELDGEETDESKINKRSITKSEFFKERFKGNNRSTAGRAMLYFQRDTKLKLMQTFMVDRENGFLVADTDIPQNVRNFKQKLLNTVVDYLKSIGYRTSQLGEDLLIDENDNILLYDEDGIFQDILGVDSPLRRAIHEKLDLDVSFNSDTLKNYYEDFRSEKDGWQEKKAFIDAYNAKLLLDDFDTITTMLLGTIIKPSRTNYDQLSNDSYETKISRATNMWSNGLGDEVEDIADLVSDVTQMLIQTSKRYTWKGEPMEDQYLSFQDFNHIVTKVKKLSREIISKNLVLDDTFFNEEGNSWDNISAETKRSIATLKQLKAEQGYTNTDPTLEDLLSFISDNPQRHLHSVFDLLCNTNILDNFHNITPSDKNLIWTVGKELFGTWPDTIDAEGNVRKSRSLYDLHNNSNNDRIFEIVTQIADSMFADDFLQFYEDQEGTLKLRFLQDYSVSQEKNQLLYRMKQSNGMYDPERFQRYRRKYNIEVVKKQPTKIYQNGDRKKPWMVPNPNYDPNVEGSYRNYFVQAEFLDKVVIPITNSFKIEYQDGKLTRFDKLDEKYRDAQRKGELLFYTESIWKSDNFRNFVKDTIGIDFNTDVELTAAYEELFKNTNSQGRTRVNYTELLNDISNLCGAVTFNQTFNNEIVPTILSNSARERNKRNVSLLRDLQFQGQFLPRIDAETGMIEMLSDTKKDAYLSKLGTATAMTRGLLTSAQVKTGEGTALASQQLSCLRASYAYQFLTQNRRADSATRGTTIVNNENGLFRGNIKNREYKSDYIVKVNTDMSSAESFTASFLGGFVGAFINSEDSSTINRNGNAFLVPAVYSDKTTQELLALQLKAGSRYQKDENGNPKQYINMSDAELELEMKYEFGEMYDSIIKNINNENLHFAQILGINTDAIQYESHPIEVYRGALREISYQLCDSETLLNLAEKKDSKIKDAINQLTLSGKTAFEIEEELKKNSKFRKTLGGIRKNRIIEQMHNMMTDYNRTHRRKPIEMCEHVHYLYDKDGMLVPNDTLIALWGRFKGNAQLNEQLGITNLYPDNHKKASTAEGYFKYEKDLRMAQELLTDGVEIFLRGALSKENQEELEYLRTNFPDWITHSGKMTIAKVFIPSTKYNVGDSFNSNSGGSAKILQVSKSNEGTKYFCTITKSNGDLTTDWFNESQLDSTINNGHSYIPVPVSQRQGTWEVVNDPKLIEKYAASPETRDMIQIHPMLSKLNRISYLAAQQYTSAVGGAHYVYKGGGANVLEEEANRWLASNKRNVCYASTVHKYQNKTLNGIPKVYQIAPIEDIKSVIYSIMGDLDSHKPIDGGMYVNPWFPILENNSLGGEAAGLDKKQFGTYYYEKYAAGGIIKTAGFAVTNQRQRRSDAYTALCENMTNRIWIKEYTNANGEDIEEFLDITRDYKGNDLNWVQDDKGQGTYYQRETADGGLQRFKLARIEAIYSNGTDEITIEGDARDYIAQGYRPTNRYKIYEYPVTIDGEIDTTHPDIEAQLGTPGEDLVPIQRLDGADENGEFLINSNWALYNNVFGGAWSLSKNHYGKLEPSENSIYQMVHALNNIGYTRTVDNNDADFGNERYTIESIDKVKDQDDLWQPLKYSDISYAPNIGALKSTQMNVNPKEGMYERTYLNAMNIMTAQLGIQLDKEHHADNSEVSMPTQIIQACANKGYTIHYSDKLYKSLSTLTEIAISDCMKGIMEIMPGNENKGTLLTEIANIIVDKLIHSQDDNAALEAAMAHLIQKAKDGHKLIAQDVVGKVAWSDPGLYNKIYNDLASHLTNNAIKMKFPGTLAVICPTERVEQMHGNRRLDAYANPDLGYNNANGDFIRGITAQMGLEIEQERIRTTANPQLILDEDINSNATAQDRENLASNLDTQHHYWIEWRYADGTEVLDENGNIFRESITIDTPNAYFKVKDWMSTGGKSGVIKIGDREISRRGMKVARVYENIIKGRELGAYNARFESLEKSDSGQTQRFNIFDLDSVRAMFNFNDTEVNFENACDLLEEEKFIQPQKVYALDLTEELLKKKYLKSHDLIYNYAIKNNVDIITAVEAVKAKDNSVEQDFTEAVFKICKVLTYKAMEQDLFRISKDYNGERKLWVNDKYLTVNPKTIKTQAYELIMPKVYQSRFGLEEQDQVQDILADKQFFTKRAINKLKQQYVSDDCFHYELKNFNGEHVYIWDSRLGEPDPDIFMPKRFEKFEVETGVWERQDADGNFLHGLSSANDRIMKIGSLGHEVIVTDNPEYYLENMKYNIALFSNTTVDEATLQNLVTNLKDTKSRTAQKFVRNLADRRGNLRKFRNLQKRNDAINNLSLEPVVGELPEVTELVEQFMKEGAELHASFSKSLDIIAGRIPAQSQQSFMPQRVVAFDNNDINTAYVSTFQLFLQGSDLDIDAVTLLGSEFDENGKYVIWSNIADISSIEKLEASQLIPFPTGTETEIKITNTKDSFFKTYDDYIYDLFEYDTDITEFGPVPATGEDGFRILKLKEQTPERLELLAEFLEAVNTTGLTIKGDTKSDGSWKPSEAFIEEWEGRRQLDETHWQKTTNALKDLGFNTPEAAYSALLQIKNIIDKHNTYINTADQKTRERMTKNQCQWAMYQICSTPSNLVELMVGVDVSTAPIKDKETGAVVQSPYNGDDKQAAPGNYNTIHRSFQEGQIGKQCVGIGAVSIKVNSTMQYYMDKRLSTGTEEEKERLLFPKVDSWGRRVDGAKQSYIIGGKERLGMFNLYDKSSETADFKEVEVNGETRVIRTAQENNEIITLLASIQTEDDITPNVAMSLAAMLSVAVDFCQY